MGKIIKSELFHACDESAHTSTPRMPGRLGQVSLDVHHEPVVDLRGKRMLRELADRCIVQPKIVEELVEVVTH